DEKWIVFTAPAQHLFERLCAMIGQPDLPRDPRFASATERPKHIGVIVDLMRQWFAARPAAKALAELTGHDIPHSPIMSMADIFADPHYRARGTIKEKSHRAKRRCYRSGVWTLRGTHTRRLDGHSLYNAQRAQGPRDFQADHRSVRSAPSQLRWRRDSDQGGRRPTRADVALGQR